MNRATEGTPALSSRKSMWYPGGAILPLGGVVKLSWPEPVHVVCNVAPHKPIKRCSMSNACVLEPGRTSTAELIGEALL